MPQIICSWTNPLHSLYRLRLILYQLVYCLFTDLTANTVCVAVARVGASNQKICTATLKDMSQLDMGPPLHSMVIPGHMHPLEKQMLQIFSNNDEVKKILDSMEDK